MDILIQICVNSLIIGSLYGLIAMSFSLIYRSAGFFNLAHGTMIAIGGYVFMWLHHMNEVSFLPSVVLAVSIAGLCGFLIDRYIFAPQRRRQASNSVLLVVSLGVLIVLEALLSMAFGTQFRVLTLTQDAHSYLIGPTYITQLQLWTITINVLVFAGLLVLLYKAKLGKLIRAITDNRDVARSLGIQTDRYIGIVFFIASALAGLAGILTGLDTGLQPTMGFLLLLNGIIAAIIGCVTSLPGAFLGGFFLAVVENTGVYVWGGEWRHAVTFSVFLIFLMFRPQGILGKRDV